MGCRKAIRSTNPCMCIREAQYGARVCIPWALLATISSTRPRAFCRMDIACSCEIFESRGCPSIASIWSPSTSRPSLQKRNKKDIALTKTYKLYTCTRQWTRACDKRCKEGREEGGRVTGRMLYTQVTASSVR